MGDIISAFYRICLGVDSVKTKTSTVCSQKKGQVYSALERKQLVVDVREREEQGGRAGVLCAVQLPLYTVTQVSACSVQKCIAQYTGNCCTVQLGRGEGGGGRGEESCHCPEPST